MKLRIVLLGSSRYIIPIIQTLKSTRSRFNLELVVTTEQSSTDAVPSYCIKNEIKFISAHQFNNKLIRAVKDANASLAILAYFGLIIPQEVLEIFPNGILNIHPSLLPKYRGPSPVQAAILNADKTTGVTIIKLDDKVDHGQIIVQKKEAILQNDTSDSLSERLFKIGAKLLEQNINKYVKGEIKISKQDHSKATFTKALSRKDGFFDVNNPPSAEALNRMIKAYYPWPGVWTKSKFRSSTRGVDAHKIIKFLPEKRIQVEGKKTITYKDFINGYSQGKEILKKLNLS